MKDETKAKLEALVAAGVAENVDSATEIAVSELYEAIQPSRSVSAEEASILNERLDALDKDEGIPFENGNDLMGRIMKRVLERKSKPLNA